MKSTNFNVGLGQYRVARGADEEWIAYGLGSCIGLILYDHLVGASGLAHIVLPEAPEPQPTEPTRYVDSGVPFLYNQLIRIGARPGQISAMMVGGARVLVGSGLTDIGARNTEAARALLVSMNVPLVAERVGGTLGYTLRWYTARMYACVRQPGGLDERLVPPQLQVREVDPNGASVGC